MLLMQSNSASWTHLGHALAHCTIHALQPVLQQLQPRSTRAGRNPLRVELPWRQR
jgi:hypothetical protein